MENQEVWKDVINYEGLYQVSNLGRVKSVSRYIKHWRGGFLKSKEIIKKPFKSKSGYLIIELSKNSSKDKFLIHRLVAEAFIPNTDNKPQVNHINGIKTDNRVENLEWNTRSENIKHADSKGLRNLKGVNNANAKLSEKEVIEIRQSENSIDALAVKYNVGTTCIKKILNKKTWRHI
jgi:hypothetical protein